MFISKAEKQNIYTKIENLQMRVHELSTELFLLKSVEPKRTPPYIWSDDQRNAQSERMKKVWANKKEARA